MRAAAGIFGRSSIAGPLCDVHLTRDRRTRNISSRAFQFKNRQLLPGERIGIASGDGVSCLTLDDVTYDHAGKYEVSVENSAGKERRFFSLAVEGEPLLLCVRVAYKLAFFAAHVRRTVRTMTRRFCRALRLGLIELD